MAHKGQRYEVAFRRDFSVNLNRYSDGAALKYRLTVRPCLGPLGSLLNFNLNTLPGGLVTPGGIQEWFTAEKTLGAYKVKLRLWAKIDGNPQQIFPFIDVIERTLGLVYTTGGFGPLDSVGPIASLPPLGGAPSFSTFPLCYGPMFEPGYLAIVY